MAMFKRAVTDWYRDEFVREHLGGHPSARVTRAAARFAKRPLQAPGPLVATAAAAGRVLLMAARKRLREMKPPAADSRSISEIVGELRQNLPASDYREQSLRIHGLICAKCAREFERGTGICSPSTTRTATTATTSRRLELGESLRLLPRRRAQPRRPREYYRKAGDEGDRQPPQPRPPALSRPGATPGCGAKRDSRPPRAAIFCARRSSRKSTSSGLPRRARPAAAGLRELAARLEAGEAAGHWSVLRFPARCSSAAAHTESPQGALAVFRPRRFTLAETLGGRWPGPVARPDCGPRQPRPHPQDRGGCRMPGVVVSPGLLIRSTRSASGQRREHLPAPGRARSRRSGGRCAGARGGRLFATSPRGGLEYTAADLSGGSACSSARRAGVSPRSCSSASKDCAFRPGESSRSTWRWRLGSFSTRPVASGQAAENGPSAAFRFALRHCGARA